MPGNNGRRRSQTGRNYITRSGNSIKVNRSLSERIRAHRDYRSRRRAARLAGMPKDPVKRLMYRLNPRNAARYWFSREGAIMALKVTGIGIVVLFIFLIGLFAYFRKDLPQLKNITGSNLGGSISYYDRTGKVLLWQDYNALNRIPVQGSAMSPYMRNATVAIEDKNFYHEGAFSITSYIRAGLNDIKGGSTQGGSTITEQTVKLNENWTQNRTIVTKVKELILAVDLEREYSKAEILTGYLNVAPYGGVDYGCEAAAQDYFHTSCKDLTLPQSAFLSALPQAPSVYSPRSSEFSKSALLSRVDYILDQMAKQGYVTQAQADAAKNVNVLAEVQPQVDKYNGIKAPYFVLAAKNELEQRFGTATVNRGGWKVITTLNLTLQHEADSLVQSNYSNIQYLTGGAADEEATVTEDVPTGQILALVGGVDFTNPQYGQINYADTVKIPPGSSFKPYDYASMINFTTNTGAGSVLYDVQQPLPGYPCTNKARPFINNVPTGGNCLWDYDFIYPGAESIRYALGGSRNVPAVKAMLTVGTDKVIQTADSMMSAPNAYQCYSDDALTKPTQCYGASAIGDGAFLHLDQHVNGLSTLARLGNAIPTTFILQVNDADGKSVYKWTQPKGTQVIKPDSAYIVDNMLSDPKASYLPGYCSATNCPTSSYNYKFQRHNGWDIAVKTGTTNDGFDGLMTAWSTQYAVVSWVGNHTRNVNLSAARGTAMEYLTEPVTKPMIEYALDQSGLQPTNWQQPSDIKVLPAFVQTKHIHYGDEEPGPSKDLFPAWYVEPKGSSSTSQTIDKVSGLLATSCTPALAKQTNSSSNANTYSADIFWPINKSSTGQAITGTDNVHNCGDPQPSISLPSQVVSCTVGQPCSIAATATAASSSDPLSSSKFPGTLTISISGNNKTCAPPENSSSYTCTDTFTPTQAGTLTVNASIVDSLFYQSNATPATIQVAGASTTTTTTGPQ